MPTRLNVYLSSRLVGKTAQIFIMDDLATLPVNYEYLPKDVLNTLRSLDAKRGHRQGRVLGLTVSPLVADLKALARRHRRLSGIRYSYLRTQQIRWRVGRGR